MITIRRAETLGIAHSGGQIVQSHFSFADYQNPSWQHEGRLRAVNLATLTGGAQYALGPEAVVDIVTWVHTGTLTAKMAEYPTEPIAPAGLHVMRCGTGCATLKWCAGPKGAAFIQFWFVPDTQGTAPAQEVRPAFSELEDGGFRIIASGFPEDDPENEELFPDGAPVPLSASARLLHAALPAGEGAAYSTVPSRTLYLLVASGCVSIAEQVLNAGDAAAIEGSTELVVIAQQAAVLLLADTAASLR